MTRTAALRDAWYLTVDLHDLIGRRTERWLTSRLTPPAALPVDSVHRLATALAEAQLPATASHAVLAAMSAPLPWLPGPLGDRSWHAAQAHALHTLDELLHHLASEVQDPTRGWRPLGPPGTGGRRQALTRRQSYTPNVAAG